MVHGCGWRLKSPVRVSTFSQVSRVFISGWNLATLPPAPNSGTSQNTAPWRRIITLHRGKKTKALSCLCQAWWWRKLLNGRTGEKTDAVVRWSQILAPVLPFHCLEEDSQVTGSLWGPVFWSVRREGKTWGGHLLWGLPWGLSQWRVCLQRRRGRFNPWVRKIPWRRKWQPTPVFLPGKFYGQRSLVGYTAHEVAKVRHFS